MVQSGAGLDPGGNGGQWVIVGGGAGGLELACMLGRKFGPSRVVLVDAVLTHVWKPSLHEVAAGTLDPGQEGLSFPMLAAQNGFRFVLGSMKGLDLQARELSVAAVHMEEREILPERRLRWEKLVLALGSIANDFGVPGAREHAFFLNSLDDAEQFRLRMLEALAAQGPDRKAGERDGLDVCIIGGGATGVELAAELQEASAIYQQYGYAGPPQANQRVRLRILEGAPRVLAPLPEDVAAAALQLLHQRGIEFVTSCRVVHIEEDAVLDAEGRRYPADLCMWAAGIKATPELAQWGLPVAKSGQVRVTRSLQVEGLQDVYALGDCAWCEQADGKPVPPRAQAAHQQAQYLYRQLLGKESGDFVYRDHGSLVSIGTGTGVGNLMGRLFSGTHWFIQGTVARWMYMSLHLLHHRVILGTARTAVLALARFLVRRATARVKLH